MVDGLDVVVFVVVVLVALGAVVVGAGSGLGVGEPPNADADAASIPAASNATQATIGRTTRLSLPPVPMFPLTSGACAAPLMVLALARTSRSEAKSFRTSFQAVQSSDRP